MQISRPLAAAAAAAFALATLSGCSAIDTLFEDGPPSTPEEHHFDEYADAPTSGNLSFAMPSFVPRDASNIDVRALPSAAPGYLLRYESPKGFRDDRCETVADAPPAAILSDWWPDEFTGEVAKCSDKRIVRPVYVTLAEGTVYAWTADEPIEPID